MSGNLNVNMERIQRERDSLIVKEGYKNKLI